MRVLGIDPGTAATGYGVVDSASPTFQLIECGVVRPRRGDELAVQLAHIHAELTLVIDRLKPTCLAVEGVFYHRNARTAIVLAHARASALLAGAQRGLPVAEYPPAEIKKAVVGTGRATKTQVGYMVQKHLNLVHPPRPADAADGCAVALCHLITYRAPRSGRLA